MTKVKAVRNRVHAEPIKGLYLKRNLAPRYKIQDGVLVQEVDAHCLDSTTIGADGVLVVLPHRRTLADNLRSLAKLIQYIRREYGEQISQELKDELDKRQEQDHAAYRREGKRKREEDAQ